MEHWEALSIAWNVVDDHKDELTTPEKVIDYVNENFFTFTEDEKTQVINEIGDALFALPFC